MYHTQEKWENKLLGPIPCKKNNAWLGFGYYFWEEEIDAIQWGHKSKKGTGYFEIYQAEIDCDGVLDTVFNEDHYRFWLKQIEKAATFITKMTGIKANLKEINEYFRDKAKWSEVTNGVMFQDLPVSEDLLVSDLYYRKRIQLAVYNLEIISNFAFHFDLGCN
jgi:hypothetical protein